MINKILSSPSLTSTNFWTSLLLVITAFFKATNVTLISDSFENIAFAVSGIISALNIILKVDWKALIALDWKSINFLNFTRSTNFYLQLWAFLISAFPVILNYASTQDVEKALEAINNGDYTLILGLGWAVLAKILSSFIKPKQLQS